MTLIISISYANLKLKNLLKQPIYKIIVTWFRYYVKSYILIYVIYASYILVCIYTIYVKFAGEINQTNVTPIYEHDTYIRAIEQVGWINNAEN